MEFAGIFSTPCIFLFFTRHLLPSEIKSRVHFRLPRQFVESVGAGVVFGHAGGKLAPKDVIASDGGEVTKKSVCPVTKLFSVMVV